MVVGASRLQQVEIPAEVGYGETTLKPPVPIREREAKCQGDRAQQYQLCHPGQPLVGKCLILSVE
jgi:hypothetical protein